MKTLADVIEVAHRNVRSVNVESELMSVSPLDGFVPTAQVLDGVRRVLRGCEPRPVVRAWSVTGPYGAGKSSFAHFLCSLVGPGGEPAYRVARRLLKTADPGLATHLAKLRRALEVSDRGFIRAAVTADRAPVSSTIARALHLGAEDYWAGRRGRRPNILHALQTTSAQVKDGNHPDPAFVLDALDDLILVAPVLIVVDELGKALEYAAHTSREADLYLLQQIAERFSTSEDVTGGFLALQHLAFEDYATGLSPARRHEWRKIQGRFDDVAFGGGASHAAKVIATTLVMKAPSDDVRAAMQKAETELLSVSPGLRSTLDSLGAAPAGYPFHPTVIPAIAELAGRFGQHDRSLMAFLTSDAPDALLSVLRAKHGGAPPEFVRLADVYDFYVDGAASLALAGEDAARMREVRGRIADASPTDEFVRRCLKTVGILNLVGRAEFTASRDLITQALVGPGANAASEQVVMDALTTLEQTGLLTYREFAGEYRVWQGSDFDVERAFAEERQHVAREAALSGPPIDQVAEAFPPRPVVARRHSQRFEVLRYFEARYDTSPPRDPPQCSRPDSDGLLLYVLSDGQPPAAVPAATQDGRPLVVVLTSHSAELVEAAVDAVAGGRVLRAAAGRADRVAIAEIRHRTALLQTALRDKVQATFDPLRTGVRVYAGGAVARIEHERDFAETLSRLCDQAYHRSPVLRSEMLNRRELSSQGASARRELLEKMFTAHDVPRLGISGFGPERAMYESVLAASGIHRDRGGGLGFGGPAPESGLAEAWQAIREFLDAATGAPVGVDRLYHHLMAPPIGMKEGPIPVLLAAVLLARADDIFVFEEETFLPRLGSEHFERLLKTPDRFALKRASLLGVRGNVFRDMHSVFDTSSMASLPAGLRNTTTLAIVRPLITLLQRLPEYTRQTGFLSTRGARVRDALATTTEPDELLFEALPAACGFEVANLESTSGDYLSALKDALDELECAYGRLLDRIRTSLRIAFDTRGPDHALREELRSRSRHLTDHVIDRRLRSFLVMAANEDLDDEEWIEGIATVLAHKPPRSWTDGDLTIFESMVLEVARPFRRLEVMHLQIATVQHDGFSVRRLTMTMPDGVEVSQLVWLEERHAGLLAEVVEHAAEEARRLAGSDAAEGLLALLAEKLMASTASSDPTGTVQGVIAQ